ncbi:MAG: competence/damage-inducible protein A [Myxococcales bacterium FL481]|nr:MAG: competence/damage-inducible protein A [Myxococcales bacterium FL481]
MADRRQVNRQCRPPAPRAEHGDSTGGWHVCVRRHAAVVPPNRRGPNDSADRAESAGRRDQHGSCPPCGNYCYAAGDVVPPTPTARAAALLIGNELLSGKIRDENGTALARFLRRRGIALREMTVVPDEVDTIASALRRLTTGAGLVFTSGGVGPTHDDVTLAGVASAFARPLEHNDEMAAALRRSYGTAANEAVLRMARLPAGTHMLQDANWPVLRLDVSAASDALSRVYVLPGVPALFRAKLDALAAMPDELPNSRQWVLATVETTLDESRIAAALDHVVARHPPVEIGSYPRWIPGPDGRLRQHVRITIEARRDDRELVDSARNELLQRLSALDARAVSAT